MTVTLDKTHELKGNSFLLGVGGENESEQIVINIAYDVLLDKWAYIEFEQNGEKYTTERLTIANGQIVYVVPNGLLAVGDIFVQAVFRDASGFVWKSFKRKYLVTDEINACNNYPQTYPDFVTEVQTMLDDITVESEKVDAVLSTEEARVTAEAERVENEAERVATESERITAETARASAETERQTAETARADAETTRRTEFAEWADSIGNLTTYDKRLINLEEAGVGTLFDYQTDDTTAYSKTVPANALPYARLVSVGGMTYKADDTLTDTLVKSVGGYTIPEAIQMLDGYGLGIDESIYNYVNYAQKTFVQKVVAIEFNGTEKNWIKSFITGNQTKRFAIPKPVNAKNQGKGKCNLLDWVEINVSADSERTGAFGEYIYVTVEATKAESVEMFKEWLSQNPVRCVYELATPIETDISAYLTDSYIKVDGTIIFENDEAQAVPSEIVYAVKR